MLLAPLLIAAAPVADDPDAKRHSAACVSARIDDGVVARDRACIAFKPKREFDGLWIDAFEGQEFIEGARDPARLPRRTEMVWIDMDRPAAVLGLAVKRPISPPPAAYSPRVYRIHFVGAEVQDRRRRAGVRGWMSGYGHLGVFAGLVVLDRVLSIEDLGPLPPTSDNLR